ncbi:hypothetical protein [Caulobacter flavus]|nr:hypothetical protein [Caulobacter flavus]
MDTQPRHPGRSAAESRDPGDWAQRNDLTRGRATAVRRPLGPG